MAGTKLTATQRRLWKQAEQPGGLQAMSEDDLRVWSDTCHRLAAEADHGPAKAAKARALWNRRARATDEVLAAREAE